VVNFYITLSPVQVLNFVYITIKEDKDISTSTTDESVLASTADENVIASTSP
jgi:hypothetical protein